MFDIPEEDVSAKYHRYYQQGEWRDSPAGRRFVPGQGASLSGDGGGSGGGDMVNASQSNPNLDFLWNKYKDRLSADTLGRDIDRSNSAIADSAALLGKDARANLAQRGASGSGVGAAFIQKRITEPAQRQAASAAANLTAENERRQDALVLGGTGLARAGADLGLQERSLALQQRQLDQQIAMQQQQQMMALLGMMGGV